MVAAADNLIDIVRCGRQHMHLLQYPHETGQYLVNFVE